MPDAAKLKDEFQRMLSESKYYLSACENAEYITHLNRIEENADYFTKLEKYGNVPFFDVFYKYKCKKLNKELYTLLLDIHSSLGEERWHITQKFVESNG